MIRSRTFLGISAFAGLCSIAVPFWPLSVVAIAAAAFGRHAAVALMLGAFFDLLYGAPNGVLSFVYLPCTVFALSSVGLQRLLSNTLRKPLTDRL